MRGRSLLLCASLFCLSAPAWADHLQFSYQLPDPQVANSDTGMMLNLPGAHRHDVAGAPDLPVWPMRLLLPAGHEALSLSVRYEDVELQSIDPLRPHQQDFPISQRQLATRTAPDADLYGSDAFWPAVDSANLSTSAEDGHCIALADLYPLRYNPVSGELSIAHRIVVEVETAANERFLPPRADHLREVRAHVDNPQALATYQYADEASRTDDVEMLIITDDYFLPAFQLLADYKNSLGLSCEIQYIMDILDAQDGRDNAERLRNHLIAQYATRNVRYVLLGGDTEYIPLRSLYVDTGGGTADHLPSDFYYAALDGDWNADGDSRWGEPGEEDWYAELAVGRAGVSTLADAQNFVHKQISYQDDPVTADVSSYLLVGEQLNDDPVTWGGDCKDEVADGSSNWGMTTTGFPTTVGVTTLYDRDHFWANTELFSALSAGVNFSNHLGHSNWNYVMKFSNDDVTTSNFPSNGDSHSYHLGYSQGCIPGAFDEDACILERLTNLSTGYAAFIGNSRYGWYSPGQTSGPSQLFDRQFFDALFGEGIRELAAANNDSKHDLVSWANSQGTMRWCYYELNLFGDPSLIPWSSPPCMLQVFADNQVLPGTNSIDLSISVASQSPEGTRVALLNEDGTLLGASTADAAGDVQLLLDTPMTEVVDYELVVSGFNLRTHRETITLIEPENAHLASSAMSFTDSNGNGVMEAAEPCALQLTLTNYGNTDAHNVVLTLLTSDNYAVTQGSLICGTIAAGGSATPGGTLQLIPAFSLADGAVLSLQFEAVADEGSWEFELRQTVQSPVFGLGTLLAQDGSNDHLDPQESTSLVLELLNNGEGSYLNGSATLLCSTPGVTITSPAQQVGNLAYGESQSLSFAMNIGGALQNGDNLEFTFQVHDAQSNLRYEQVLQLQLGDVEVGYESGALDELNWESEGASWSVTSSGAAEGSYCARSGSIGHNSRSVLYVERWFDCITQVAFQYKVSSEQGFDFLRFEVDEVPVASWSGEVDWSEYSYNVSPGFHRIGWRYAKDGGAVEGNDCAWLDALQLGPAPQARIACDTESINLTLAAGASTTLELALSNPGSDELHWQAMALAQSVRSFSDDMEDGDGDWTHDGTHDNWHRSTQRAYSGSTSWYCGVEGDEYQNDTHSWLISPAFLVEPEATFGFRHWIDMEIASATHAWDGGLVEISLEGSDTWTVINPLGGYPYLVEPNEDSPFDANTPVFSGSVNWELAEFDLADYAGQIVRVRFRFGSDAAVTEEGWYIDDVSLSGIGVDWLSIDPTSGTVLPDGSQTLTLSVDATDQEPGALEAVLLFVSDAVNAPSLAVPVSLVVGMTDPISDLRITLATPMLQLQWSAQSGALSYLIQRCSEPYGTYSTVGTTTDTFWQEQIPRSSAAYYRVIVER